MITLNYFLILLTLIWIPSLIQLTFISFHFYGIWLKPLDLSKNSWLAQNLLPFPSYIIYLGLGLIFHIQGKHNTSHFIDIAKLSPC